MVAVDMMTEVSDDIDVVDMDESIERINSAGDKDATSKNQVVIYESDKPLLKVEAGITLEIMKLLYEAEFKDSSQDVIGLRPRKTTSGMPCILTLKESKLENENYDLILKDQRSSSSTSPPNSPGNDGVTTRCIDCSRESWKSKRFTSVGMNTEISINPMMEIDSLRNISLQKQHPVVSQSTNEKVYQPRPRGRPPTIQRPVPHGIIYSNVHKKDYVMAVPSIPMPNGIVPAPELEFYDRRRYRHHSPPRRSPPMQHVNGRTQINYPVMGKSEMENTAYDLLPRHNRHSPSTYSRHHSPPRHLLVRPDLSPPHRARSRSPVYPCSPPGGLHGHTSERLPYMKTYVKGEPVEMYYPRHIEENSRSSRSSPGKFPQYEPQQQQPTVGRNEIPSKPSEKASSAEVEPPVYVLPNDFDMKRDPLEPHIVSYHEPKNYQASTERDNLPNGSEQRKHSSKSPSSDATKSVVDTPPEKALSCKICKQTFPTKSTLYKHLRGHSSDEKPFKCSECGQGFTLSSNLRQHRIIHRGYKPFQCEYCGKKFMRSNVYKQHRRIHTGEQMHKCDICPSEFLQRYALVKHMKKVHNIDAVEN